MRLLFDTSTLIAALVEVHPAHRLAYPWLQGVKDGHHISLIGVHSLAELYSKLTRIPFAGGVLPPAQAQQIIETDLTRFFEIISLAGTDSLTIIEHLSNQNLGGGIIFDALIFHAAIKSGADRLLALNPKHFQQIYPELATQGIDPGAEATA
jgi:predicted nucleic acid-binding protein